MILYAAGPNLESTVADRGEGPGPLFLDQNEAEALRAKNVILDRPLYQGLDYRTRPPSPPSPIFWVWVSTAVASKNDGMWQFESIKSSRIL